MTEEEILKRWEDIALERRKSLIKVADSYLWWSGLFNRLGIANKFLIWVAGIVTMLFALKDQVVAGLHRLLGG